MTFDVEQFATQFSIVKQQVNGRPLRYLDNAATSQMPDCVIEAVARHDKTRRANVRRGIHYLSEEADAAYEGARADVARYLGIDRSEEIVFTGGATDGINFLAYSLGMELEPGDEVLISELEHHSNIVPWQLLAQRKGIVLTYLPVTEDGRLNVRNLDRYITKKTKIVSVTHGSNVTGAVADAPFIAEMAHKAGALLILDGAQTAPNLSLNLSTIGADFYVFSGHKVHGPSGIGVLWGRKALLDRMPPVFGGGEMVEEVSMAESVYLPPPHRFEAGTPPITQAVGLAAALAWFGSQDLPAIRMYLKQLTAQLVDGLTRIDRGRNTIRIVGPHGTSNCLPIVSFAVQHLHPHDICQVLNDRHGVALRGGHHCAQLLHDRFGLDGTTRASLAAYNRQADIDAFLNGVEDCIHMFGK